MTAAEKKAPSYYVSTSNDNRVRVSFWPGEIEMHVSMTLTEGEARRLAASLLAQADTLPRVASAADLGIMECIGKSCASPALCSNPNVRCALV